MLAGVLAVIASFAIGGPMGRLRGSVGLASLDASSSAGGEAIAQVTTTTTVAPAGPTSGLSQGEDG